jgi:hypothetical protein
LAERKLGLFFGLRGCANAPSAYQNGKSRTRMPRGRVFGFTLRRIFGRMPDFRAGPLMADRENISRRNNRRRFPFPAPCPKGIANRRA